MKDKRYGVKMLGLFVLTMCLLTMLQAPLTFAQSNQEAARFNTGNSKRPLILRHYVTKGVWRFEEFIPLDWEEVPEHSFYKVNVYAIETDEGIILVDCGVEELAKQLHRTVRNVFRGKKIKAVILTHGHADHAGAGSVLQKKGVEIYAPAGDLYMIEAGSPGEGTPEPFTYTGYSPDGVYEGDSIFGFNIIPAMGHTIGNVAFTYETSGKTLLFTGDATISRPEDDVCPLDMTFELELGTLLQLIQYAPALWPIQIASNQALVDLAEVIEPYAVCPGHNDDYGKYDVMDYLLDSLQMTTYPPIPVLP